MKHRNSHLLVGYWSRLRRGRAVPDQTEIDPRSIKRMLATTFILDASDTERPLYRLAGTALCERFGGELRGSSYLAHWEDQSRVALCGLLKQALAVRQPLSLLSIGATTDCGMVEMETVLAPITFNNAEPMRFLGMTQVLTDINALCGRPIAFERLIGSQIVREDDPIAISDLPPPVIDRWSGHPRAPHLRLVVNQGQNTQPQNTQSQAQPAQGVEKVARRLDVFGTGIAVEI
ncbi:MAG TPA: PAS domain-containing protein [Rhizomicrobium sp.]|nr:PAS domain-containing protein [Rhizomicrobium sp.]